jgi:predicted TIM-barrel fold metal-dependent hydrolase
VTARIIDCDVHQELNNADDELLPYLTAGWQEFVRGYEKITGSRSTIAHGISTNPTYRLYASNPLGYDRKDAIPADGSFAGSSRELMVEQLLDPFDVELAILTGGELGLGVSGHSNPYFAREVARAYNEHLRDYWLDFDPRFRGSIAPALQVPEWGAQEIYRWADEPRMVQTLACTNPHAHPFGHPIYDCVHRACAETGRPFAIHSLGDGAAGAIPYHLASGQPSMYYEFHVGGAQGMMTHLVSFIVHGVFDRYPDLKLILIKGGVTWAAPFIIRMDEDFKALRREMPWCKKLPSEYVRDNVLITTQPIHVRDHDDPMFASMAAAGMEDVLAFSSDYPHWDTDVPTQISNLLPDSWRDKVMRENAARAYHVPVVTAAA